MHDPHTTAKIEIYRLIFRNELHSKAAAITLVKNHEFEFLNLKFAS